MTKKIFRSIFGVTLAALAICFGLTLGVLYNYFGSVQKDALKSQLLMASTAVEQNKEAYLEKLDPKDFRLTWVDQDGTVLFDTQYDAKEMENHAEREEIREAMEVGNGECSRYSKTLTEKTIYSAKRLSDGTVLRISISHATIPLLVLGMQQPIALVFVLALIVSVWLAKRISRKIVEPLNELDLERPVENNAYDELAPMLSHIDKQHRQIRSQEEELESRKNEFYTVVQHMNEGLVLLNRSGQILSINPAAADFFSIEEDCTGKDFLQIERNHEISKTLQKAKEEGHSEISVSRNEREYQLNISRINAEEKEDGIVILIFDVTDKVFAERNRREFTANVSHELKTPLHSIMGSAELLENNLVKKDDIPRFVGHIRSEASRLLSLIEDIIRLSQFDEDGGMSLEPVDLYALAGDEVRNLKEFAEQKHVTFSIEGEPGIVQGVPQLCHEIIYNLCDNAIKYNVEGGKVDVRVFKDGNAICLSVADTGIGIPAGHTDRIFERFYRVDKSHSKETGGTGLGLSIVKHAVQYMNGTISLESKPGVGTTITVKFPG